MCHKNKIQGGCSNYREKQDGHSNIKKVKKNNRKWVINTTDIPLTEAQESLLVPWAKLCSGSQASTYYRSHNSGRENMSEYGQRRSRRIERGGQGHPQEDKDEPPQVQYFIGRTKGHRRAEKRKQQGNLNSKQGGITCGDEEEEYIKKAEELLLTDTYKTISNDPTNKHKTKVDKTAEDHQSRGGDQ